MYFLSRLFIFVFGLALATHFALADFANDLSLDGGELTFDPASGIVEKQTIKIYATVRNNGTVDLIGTVKFFVDGAQISIDQPVSVKQGSIPDEVFINWITTPGNHIVISQLYPYERNGDNPNNNIAEKKLYVDYDTDGDGVGNLLDTDDDNDGLSDEAEKALGTSPTRSDSDGDNIGDKSDIFPLDPTEWADADNDQIGDNADTDDDNDGLPDEAEKALGTNPFKADTDEDGCDDLNDQFPIDSTECLDSDGDGVGDQGDRFPNDANESKDSDGDGIGDNADLDDDNDGVPDAEDAFPTDPTESKDTDNDGVGDTADTDDDNDGHIDKDDIFPLDPTEWADSDKDGLGDNADPNDANQGPVIVIEGNRLVIVGRKEIFNASSSTDVDGEIKSWVWDFGDDTPIVENPITPHIFERVGQYTLKLTVTDNTGESRVREMIVIAENPRWLENTLKWLLLILLLIFSYIFWRTVQEKKGARKMIERVIRKPKE